MAERISTGIMGAALRFSAPSESEEIDTVRELFERGVYQDRLKDGKWPGLEEFVVDAKAKGLRPLLSRNPAPSEVSQEALLIFGEAVSNFYKHTRAPVLKVCCTVQRVQSTRLLRMVFTYQTPVFNTEPPLNDLYAESGRGICLMRGIADRARFRFEDGALQLTLAMRWEAI